MPLKIPRQHKAILVKLLTFTKDERNSLLDALQSLEARPLSVQRLTRELQERSSLSQEEAADILGVVTGLHSLSYLGPTKHDQVVPKLIETIATDPDYEVSREDTREFAEFITAALEIKVLEIASKSQFLQLGHDRLLANAKIFSDLRPVFGNEVKSPSAFSVSHQLCLSVYRGPEVEQEEIYIALDRLDLDALRDVIERAQRKHASLHDFADSVKIPFFITEDS